MGRPTSDVWKHFKKIRSEDGNKIQSVICIYCSTIYTFPNATRLRNHLGLKCQKCLQDLKKNFQEDKKKDVDVVMIPNVQSKYIKCSCIVTVKTFCIYVLIFAKIFVLNF